MQHALTWFMTGPAPEARSGDAAERRSGFVALADVLAIIHEQTDRFEAAILDLKTSFRDEANSTRALVDTYRAETNRRLDSLEHWKNEQELADAIRRGFWHVVALGLGKLATHWQVVWALVALVLGLAWTITGNQPVGIGPVQP